MDEDLDALSHEQLFAEIKKLRNAIRTHRDASGQELCWHDLSIDRGPSLATVHEWLRKISPVP